MVQQMEEVLVLQEEEEASAVMAILEQCDRTVQHFHTHILFLEDVFFSAQQQKHDVFDMAYASLMPADTTRFLSPEQMEGADQRLQRLLRSFEMTCQDELALLREEGDALKQRMAHIITVSDEKWKSAERRRQDDFVEMSVACQKELAAMIAELRMGVLTFFQNNRMSAILEEALDVKMNELRVLQGKLEEMTEFRMKEFMEHQKQLQEERERHRERFLALKDETTRITHELTVNLEEQHQQHLREIRELQRQHTVQLQDLERQLHEERESHTTEFQRHMKEVDQYRAAMQKLVEEKKELTQQLNELHLQTEEWRRRSSERDSRAKLEQIEQQAIAEELRVEEAQAFRKQLINTVRRNAASPPPIISSSPSPGRRIRNAFLRTAEGEMQDIYAAAAAEKSFSSPYSQEWCTSAVSQSVDENSVNHHSTLTLHKPTSSYTRLMNLSEQLKKHIESN